MAEVTFTPLTDEGPGLLDRLDSDWREHLRRTG